MTETESKPFGGLTIEPKWFDGLTLEEACERLIFRRLARPYFEQTGQNVRHIVHDWWPCCSMARFLPVELWLDKLGQRQQDDELVEAMAFAWGAFLAPLQDGLVQAVGHTTATGAVHAIERSIWKRESTRIKILAGEIGRAAAGPFERERATNDTPDIATEFFAVTFSVAHKAEDTAREEALLHVTVKEDDPPKKRGRPRQPTYSTVMSEIMNELNRGEWPVNGADLCRRIEDKFEDLGYPRPDKRTVEKWVAGRDESLWRFLTGRAAK